MNTLLWLLVIVGAWNSINMAARIYCKEPWTPYLYSVFIGSWATYLLFA